MRRAIAILVAAAIVVAGCTTAGAPILANPPAARPSIAAPTDRPVTRPPDPLPVILPRDDGPHDRLTEWWYYTGHLRASGRISPEEDRRFGFEYVIFRAERGTFPTSWVSHLAITDEQSGHFFYSQRLEVGEGVDRSLRDGTGAPTGFDLRLRGIDPSDPATFDRPVWQMTGANGSDHLGAVLSDVEATAAGLPDGAGLGLGLTLTSRKPAVLHDGDGWIDFGAAGSSYYYSRTSMAADGVLTIGPTVFDVTGDAWFDHQWGDFISVGGGGWDWFAINLDDDTDLTLSLVRDADGSYPLIYGTLVRADGSVRHLDRTAFTVEVSGRWTSPTTGADYPAGWTIAIPDEDLTIELTPTVADQELDTRATTGVVYWEGSQRVEATRFGEPLSGEGYVELTGYAAFDGPN
ncbi:MAG: lipocalin family protein [Candidatus Limnocylindrales bacterium]